MSKVDIQTATRQAAKAYFSGNKQAAAVQIKQVIQMFKKSAELLLPADQDQLLNAILKIAVKLDDNEIASELTDMNGIRTDLFHSNTLTLLDQVSHKRDPVRPSEAVLPEIDDQNQSNATGKEVTPKLNKDEIIKKVVQIQRKVFAYFIKKSNLVLHNKHLPVWILLIAVLLLYKKKQNINIVQSLKDFVSAGMNILGV